MDIRVRFAPSPTGPLHIGGVRTALYNYLFAKKLGGAMILRIEDTDQNRFVEGAEQYIIDSLKWCGITFDESVEAGGEYGPYRQSERKDIYRQYIQQLISEGKAYYAFDTPEELEEMRNRLTAKGVATPQYDFHVRGEMNNSLNMSTEDLEKRIHSGEAYVIRMLIPENEDIKVNDIIRGEVVVHSSRLDDKVLFKSDGMPTYHFANIVDDHLMKISHVIRGEEWLPSAPLHVLLYKAFNWDAPFFAHLPLILKPEGSGKLSKRDGDRLGFPVFPLEWKDPKSGEVSSGYRESGYLKEAFVNILAFLGWNPGTEQEIFSLEELTEAFSLERVGKAGARFDLEKAKWFNQQFLKEVPAKELVSEFKADLVNRGVEADDSFIEIVIELIKERITFASELWEQSSFFFVAPEEYDAKVINKRWKEGIGDRLKAIITLWEEMTTFDASAAKELTMEYITSNELNMGQIMNCIRLSLVGASKGPDLFDIAAMIGREETIQRIQRAIETIE